MQLYAIYCNIAKKAPKCSQQEGYTRGRKAMLICFSSQGDNLLVIFQTVPSKISAYNKTHERFARLYFLLYVQLNAAAQKCFIISLSTV